MFKEILERSLKNLTPREQDIVLRKSGILGNKETLNSLSKKYNLSRERIRQIQNQSLKKIYSYLKNDFNTPQIKNILERSKDFFSPLGIKKESFFLTKIKNEFNFEDEEVRIFKFFLEVLGIFIYQPENNFFYSFYAKEKNDYLLAKNLLEKLYTYLYQNSHKHYSEEELIAIVQSKIIKNYFNHYLDKEHVLELVRILKIAARNPFNFWGSRLNKLISPKSLGHKIFLILKQTNQPLHFSLIHQKLEEIKKLEDELMPSPWKKDYNIESIKNELIRNKDFVLVGRGVYALREWGLIDGPAKWLMFKFLQERKRVTREELWKFISQHRNIKKSSFYVYLREIKEKVEVKDNYLIFKE